MVKREYFMSKALYANNASVKFLVDDKVIFKPLGPGAFRTAFLLELWTRDTFAQLVPGSFDPFSMANGRCGLFVRQKHELLRLPCRNTFKQVYALLNG